MIVDGEVNGSMSNYFQNKATEIKNHINAQDEDYILKTDTDELVDFFIQHYILPEIEIDSTQENMYEKASKSTIHHNSQIIYTVGIPIILKEDIEKTISHRADTYLTRLSFKLRDNYLTTNIIVSINAVNADGQVTTALDQLKQTINYKNNTVEGGSRNLRAEIKRHIETLKDKYKKVNELTKSIGQNIPIRLRIKQNNSLPIDLKVKKKIKIIKPEPKSTSEPYLESDVIDSVIDLIRNQGKQFEISRNTYSKFSEPELRDVILGMLNAIFEGEATGESFVGEGKTDILLKLDIEGGLLSAECKYWSGEQGYQKGIDQHFGYLTWSQDYAIQITFSKNAGLSDVISNAKKATQEHSTYRDNSLREVDRQYFITNHHFPDDSKKQVEIHHLLFDLHPKKV